MGEDTVYFARKSTPRILVSFILVFVAIFVVIIGFPWVLNDGGILVLFAVLFGLLFVHVGLEYHKSKGLAKGEVENVSISDLTKAISWLSRVSEGKIISRMGSGGDAWVNVGRVADRLGGDFRSRWLTIVQNHKMPMRTRYLFFMMFVGFLPMYAMVAILVVTSGLLQLVALIALALLTIPALSWLLKGPEKERI